MPRTISTMCPMNCHPTLCGMKVTVDGNALTIAGDPTNPDSEGFLCMRGNTAHEIVGNPKRLLTPRWREAPGASWQDTTWDAAFDRIVAAMERVGPAAVGFWQGHGNAANDYGFGLKRGQMERFANLYGAQHWNPAMICWGLGGLGLGLTGALETSTKEDMGDNSDLILLWGANTVSQANTIRHVERARARGAHLVTIDVRQTEASALAHDKLILRPGTDTALALALAHVIVTEGLENKEFVAAHTEGFNAFRDHLADKTPAWAEALTGIPVEQIETLAHRFAATQKAMIVLGGSSVHKGDNQWHAARAVSCLPALTGAYGVPGGGMGPRHGARSHGAGFADLTASDRRRTKGIIPNDLEAIVRAMETGAVKVLFSLGSNFLSSFPDTERVKAALAKLDLLVAYDLFENQTIRDATHIALPGTIWLEEIGAKATNTHIHLSDQALEPAGQARPLYTLYQELAARLGVKDVYPWANQEEAMNAALYHPATGYVTVAAIRANGGRTALKISPVAYPTRRFDTPSGKLAFVSQKAAAMGLPALPELPPETTGAEDTLTLAHGRSFAHFHSFYDHARALPTLAAREDAPELWLAPADAQARGIKDGVEIEIANARGKFQARAKVTPRMPRGAVWMRDGWPGFNALTDGSSVLPETALAGFPFSVGQSHYGARVTVTPV